MKPKVNHSSFSLSRQAVLPPNTAAYVAKLTSDPAKARDFLARAGILNGVPHARRVTPKRSAASTVPA